MSDTDSTAPTTEEWRVLYDAALAFQAGECWTWMKDSMLFGIQNPETGETGYCCILGNAGVSFGMNLYLGTRGLLGYSALARSRGKTSFENLFLQCCHSVSFEDRALMEKEDLAVIRALGRRFRGRNAWPLFRDYLPGYYPWFLTAPQARFLAVALEQALDVALRVRTDERLLGRGADDEFLVRRLELDTMGTRWTDVYAAPSAPPKAPPAGRGPIDHELLEEVGRNMKERSGAWEVDHRYIPSTVQQSRRERPYFLKALTVVDGASGFVVHTHLSDPAETLAGSRNEILRAMSRTGMVPETFVITRPDVMDIVLPVANALSIDIRQVKRLPETEHFHREMAKMMKGRR